MLTPSPPPGLTRAAVRGALIGQAVGDAAGFVVEGRGPADCERYVDDVLRARRPAPGRGGFAFGQYSDDTQLARELLQSLVARGGLDPADYAGRIAAIFRDERIVGYGRSTLNAALRLIRGDPWDRTGEPPPAAGNGTAMRAAPIGLVFGGDPERMVTAAHDQGRITHQDPRCTAGAIAIAAAAAGLDEPATADLVDRYDPVLAAAIAELRTIDPAKIPLVGGAGDDGWEGISPYVTPSVLWSLYAVLRTPDDYWETVCCAIAVGGDVDTTAAMAGAISGARLGLGAIPADVAALVNDSGTWGYHDLVALADRAYDMAVAA